MRLSALAALHRDREQYRSIYKPGTVSFVPDKKNLPPALPESEVHWYFYVPKERERERGEREREQE
jgi:hypothetical protein